MLHAEDTVALVCCSNGQQEEFREQNRQLTKVLQSFGLLVWESPYLYARRRPCFRRMPDQGCNFDGLLS